MVVFDPAKPPTGGSRTSADMRANFQSLQQALFGVNLVADPTFLFWAGGDAVVPTHYFTAGTVPTIARAGTGLADTNKKIGPYCLKLVGGAAAGQIGQNIIPVAAWEGTFNGTQFSAGCWVKTGTASSARIAIIDGVSATAYSAYHTGSGTWEWLSLTTTLNGAATKLQVLVEIAATKTAYYSGLTMVIGPVWPASYIPAPIIDDFLRVSLPGNMAVGNAKAGSHVMWPRPAIVRSIHLAMGTAPATTPVIIRPVHWDGAVFQNLYATQPQVNAAALNTVWFPPDGTYRYRCFTGSINGPVSADCLMMFDVTGIGTGTVGADLIATIHYLAFARPLEQFLGHADIT